MANSALKKVVAVVLGAGQGSRMGYPINKIFLPIHGKPIIAYALECFEHCSLVDEILLVAAGGEEEQMSKIIRQIRCKKVKYIVQGGTNRHDSEQRALEALRPRIQSGSIDIILIHDGARPFVTVNKVEELIWKAREVDGAILAIPLQEEEHIALVDIECHTQSSFEGPSIWKAQTPQAFQATILLKAYDQAEREQFFGTDTASSVERIGGRIALVESDTTNLKITTAEDLLLAERLSSY